MVLAIPYLIVENGKESIKLYKELFDAKVLEHMPFTKEMGKQFGHPDDFDYENSTLHAELEIYGAKLMLTDNKAGESGGGNVEILLQLDSKEPDGTLREFIMGEVRYNTLTLSFPDEAKRLHKKLEEDVETRYKKYKSMAEK